MAWRDEAPQGKLDLIMTADFRKTSTTLHSDVVLPAATWYEKYDISTTDMHPFVNSFNAAIDPPWQARTDFQIFQQLAKDFSAHGRKPPRRAQRRRGSTAYSRHPGRDGYASGVEI